MTLQDSSHNQKPLLFLDTSKNLTVGLLGIDYKWLSFESIETKKTSSILHTLILEILEKQKISSIEETSLVYCSGPGSYTGMRMSEGVAQILKWQQVKTYSFHMYQVPNIVGTKTGTWISEAFKGEFFVYKWNEDKNSKNLVAKNDLDSIICEDRENIYCHDGEMDGESFQSSIMLIKDNPETFFKTIINTDMNKELYYYRTIEKEFQKG